MKKIFSILLTASILVMAASNKISAQSMSNSFKYSESNFETSRDALKASYSNVISTKAGRNFNRIFKNVVDTRWYETPNGSIVYFFSNGIKMKSAYSKRGHWIYTLSYYDEHKLPKDVRHAIKSIYYDYPISQVVQVDSGKERIFIVMMYDATSFKTVRVCDGEMEIVQDYQKSK